VRTGDVRGEAGNADSIKSAKEEPLLNEKKGKKLSPTRAWNNPDALRDGRSRAHFRPRREARGAFKLSGGG